MRQTAPTKTNLVLILGEAVVAMAAVVEEMVDVVTAVDAEDLTVFKPLAASVALLQNLGGKLLLPLEHRRLSPAMERPSTGACIVAIGLQHMALLGTPTPRL